MGSSVCTHFRRVRDSAFSSAATVKDSGLLETLIPLDELYEFYVFFLGNVLTF